MGSRLQAAGFRLSARAGLHAAADALAAGTDDRLDELVIRVLVPTTHQLVQILESIGAIIEAAGEIEGTDRVVGWPDHEDARVVRPSPSQHVADRSSLGRADILANPAPPV